MSNYVALINWTDQGVKAVRETVHRAEMAGTLAEKMGGHLREILWTNGAYDIVVKIEAPDDETATAIGLAICEGGNVRLTTMRAYTPTETQRILDKLP